MEQQPKWKIFIRGIGFCAGASAFGALITLGVLFLVNKSTSTDMHSEAAQVKAAALEEDQTEIITEDIIYTDQDEYATSHIDIEAEETVQEREPLTTEPVEPADVYTEKDSIVTFNCYYPDATDYVWETYDKRTGEWAAVPDEYIVERTDELYRPVSTYITAADDEHADFLVRCRVNQISGELVTSTGALHILPKISHIDADEYTTEAGTYVSPKDIPVTVTYQDGSKELVTGLNSLYFLSKNESSEQNTTVSGNITETITTVITSCDYCYINGETESIMRYQGSGETIDIPIKLIGQDTTAPIISGLHISDFEISTVDQDVPVVVTITAEDDVTAYDDLEYAFLPEGEEPQDDDWINQPSFDVDITKNGTWIAYCRDKNGNIAQEEKDIIAVDNKAPIVNLSLENDTWCTTNKIIVNARDGLSIEYRYSCAETGEDTDWILENEYDIHANSTWKVMVRDAVGNVTEQEITIDNIDTRPPVIRGIIEKTEGETIIHE